MKNQWNQFPFVLRRKILLTFLAGLASIALSLIIFIITTDHILLVLGSIIFLASLVLVRSLWSTIARGQYEIVEGVCSSVVSPMMRQYRKIQLIDEQGAERTLLLSKSAKFQIRCRLHNHSIVSLFLTPLSTIFTKFDLLQKNGGFFLFNR